mmetsp:Transcript_6896/g.42094  ORF Transcript_6896/g.42094 Transcript_6896/m.42094 type:complete len:120 (+) Transcript_6896:262-621(+)
MDLQSTSKDMVDKYEILECVGKGSFGDVFRGIDTETGEEVAIKIIDLDEAEEDIEEIKKGNIRTFHVQIQVCDAVLHSAAYPRNNKALDCDGVHVRGSPFRAPSKIRTVRRRFDCSHHV